MCYIIFLATFVIFSGSFGYSQGLPGTEALSQLKKETQIFESVVEEVLKQNFNHPYAIAGQPKAAYLRGFGVSVSFHLKVNRGTIRTFYGEMRNPLVNAPRTTTEKKLETIRSNMIETLADFGSALKQLSAKDRIAICAHIEDRNELDTSKNRFILVLIAKKGDIEKVAAKTLTMKDFAKLVDIVQY
jgi:hypothetical protein